MKFVRENMFLVILGGAVLVLGGLFIGINLFSLSDSVDAEIQARENLSKSLQAFANGKKINQEMVNQQKKRVQSIRADANQVTVDQQELNKAAYPVLKLEKKDASGAIKETVPAFPYVEADYRTWGLTLEFINKHRAESTALVSQLRVTTPPTKEEIDAEVKRLESQKTRMPGTGADAATAAMNEARATLEAATASQLIARASRGNLYCDDNQIVQQFTFGPRETTADDHILWRKQFKLWIARDVLGAIKAANDEAMATLKPNERNVLNSAVKHLLTLSIFDNYFYKGDTAGVAAAPGKPGTERPGEAASPTQRQSCKDYDVVHYSFSVVMPPRHVLLLQRKLMENKYHTVMSVKMESMAAKKEAAEYYYGNDAVMAVTFEGEFLMLTSWERELLPMSFANTLPDKIRTKAVASPAAKKP